MVTRAIRRSVGADYLQLKEQLETDNSPDTQPPMPKSDSEIVKVAGASRSPLDSDTRRELLLRLGTFGVRFGIGRLREPGATTSALARDLVAASGLDELVALLDDHFGRRSHLLKTRSAIANLKALAATVPPSAAATEIGMEIERIEAAVPELGELRLLHLVISGAGDLNEEEANEVDRLVSDDTPQYRLGMPDQASAEELQAVVVARLDAWRRRAAYPLASAERREACELVAATYERLHAELTTAQKCSDLQ